MKPAKINDTTEPICFQSKSNVCNQHTDIVILILSINKQKNPLPAKIFGGGGFLLMDILGAEKSGVNFLN